MRIAAPASGVLNESQGNTHAPEAEILGDKCEVRVGRGYIHFQGDR